MRRCHDDGMNSLYVDGEARRGGEAGGETKVLASTAMLLLLRACGVAGNTRWPGSRLIDGPTFGAVPVSPSAL